ncbi:MAG: hypothetical protein ACW98K_14575 [Candidatus Kariarchaeaceae archaeon]
MKPYTLRVIRYLTIFGILLILLQIYLLPKQEPYMDLALLEPTADSWQIASLAYETNNQSIIYPFVRNVMGRIVMLRLNVYGLMEAPSGPDQFTMGNKLRSNETGTKILLPDEKARDPEFSSHWEIQPWLINQTSTSVNFLVVTLLLFQHNEWNFYSWVSLKIIR